MSDTVYAIASGKGGVGKTTTAINLGAMLADRGNSVVVVDTDLGMANLADFLDFEIETPTLHEVLAGEADVEEAVYRAPGDIDVLPSATDIEAFVKSDPANLQGVVESLRETYDYILLDTGAGVSFDTLVPLALADGVLLVATPDVASVRDTAKTGELAERVESEVRGAVLTQRSSDILNADDVEETLGAEVLGVVPQDEAVPMGIDAGRPLAAFAPNAPAGQAYRDLAAILIGEADPDPELEAVADGETDEGVGPADGRGATDEDADENAGSATDPTESDAFDMASAGNAVSTDSATADGASSSDAESSASEAVETNADDPLSADAAQNVRRALGDESGDADALFGGQSTDEETEASSESAAAESADTDETDETGGDSADASEARSVDDLISEHISDERLGEASDGDDRLAGMGDDFAGDSSDDPLAGDEENDPLAGDEQDDPLAGGVSGDSPDGDASIPFGNDDPLGAGDSRENDVTGEDSDEPSERSDSEAVPFEDRGGSAKGDRAQSGRSADGDSEVGESSTDGSADGDSLDSDAPIGDTEETQDDRDETARETLADEARADPELDEIPASDSSEDDDSEESGGVLGRIGSLFK
ncbi:cell division ATPase MinD [Halorussus pelagicus]|uniref:cell division ATPase MinD n=1 Tax=Halorussus pelagicus TaxID=2505977 RepID=UPI000FFC42B0|nr:cell division ATPase MinD [Halorussus pelagicus]